MARARKAAAAAGSDSDWDEELSSSAHRDQQSSGSEDDPSDQDSDYGGADDDESQAEEESDDDVVYVRTDWACPQCTLINDAGIFQCSVCECAREIPQPAKKKPAYKRKALRVEDDDADEADEDDGAGARKKKKKKGKKQRLGLMDPMLKRQREDSDGDEYFCVPSDEVTNRGKMEEDTPPPEIVMTLLPFQKESLGWMKKQESSHIRGGILADEMGMGKTIQSVTLMLANKPPKKLHKPKLQGQLATKASLVVCPVAALMQWKHEIVKYTSEGAVNVVIYHGPNRATRPEELAGADIVLTTFSIVESEFRRYIRPLKKECKWCGDKFHSRQLITHQKYFCGPDAKRSDKQSKQHKKVTRKSQLKAKGSKGKVAAGGKKGKAAARGKGKKPAGASGGGRASKGKAAAAMATAAASGSSSDEEENEVPTSARKGLYRGGVIHQVSWYRITLDEAHMIKDRQCSTAQAVFKLSSEFRWCLSGTPLQNRVGELYSLIRFLQIDPYAYYYCNCKDGCGCKILEYGEAFGDDYKKCLDCGHSRMNHYCWWNKHVANPIKKHGYAGPGAAAMSLLKTEMLDQCLLRRTKKERSADISLPPRLILHRHVRFNQEETDYYTALYTQTQTQFNTFVQQGTVVNNYAHIFDLLIRLRQAVNHPWLVEHSATRVLNMEAEEAEAAAAAGAAAANAGAEPADDGDGAVCAMCREEGFRPGLVATASCGHIFCKGCADDLMATSSDAAAMLCPACPAHLTVGLNIDLSGFEDEEDIAASLSVASPKAAASPVPLAGGGASVAAEEQRLLNRKGILQRIFKKEPEFRSSTKIESLLEAVVKMRHEEPTAKAICFSQFVNMLDMIEWRLLQANKTGELGPRGITMVKLDGRLSVSQRDRVLTRFQADPTVDLLLMSLKAGGVALNLTAASRVFLMDPWWNPAVEYQAMDRIHRLGQFRPIEVVRFFIADSIEDRILRLQKKKQLVFEGTVGQDNASLARLSAEDLAFLFS